MFLALGIPPQPILALGHTSPATTLIESRAWDLQNSGLSGALVVELGNMDQLQYLLLQKNMLNGKIPESLGNLKNLIDMNLGDNAFGYNIPNFGANLLSLQFLRLQNNKLFGEIPVSLTTIPKLALLDVSNNRGLCGIAPVKLLLIKTLAVGGNPGLGQPCPPGA
ncbi:Leucine-rich repeat protein 1 [Linum perenne]